MKQFIFKYLFLIGVIVTVAASDVLGQGVTTAALSGTVRDSKGEELPGATVIAVHQPTGSRYGAITTVEGFYNLPNVQVGGPYTITVTFVGFKKTAKTGINLALGQRLKVDFTLETATTELDEVTVVADPYQEFDAARTGITTNVSAAAIADMPTVDRALPDILRLSPLFSNKDDEGASFAGQNPRYNSIMIDGATSNNVFGLTNDVFPGAQQESQLISLDAIDQVQILISPYDVRQSGFTGGGVNAITKSGSNEVRGTAYTFMRNDALVGRRVQDQEIEIDEFRRNTYGFTLGGPVVKDKLFYFVSGEIVDREEPVNFLFIPTDTVPGGGFFADDARYSREIEFLDEVRQATIDLYGYDPGDPRTNVNFRQGNYKLFTKLNWNISDNHKLTLRNNYLNSFDVRLEDRGFSGFAFPNSQYTSRTIQVNPIVELQSRINNNASNEFRFSYNRIRETNEGDNREFPEVRFTSPTGAIVSLGNNSTSRSGNTIKQDLIEITNNFTITKGDHIVTVGTNNEIQFIDNFFLQNFNGSWFFEGPDRDAFDNYTFGFPRDYRREFAVNGNPNQSDQWTAIRLALFAQDEWKVNKDVTLTLGIRGDLPMVLGDVDRNVKFEESFNLRNDVTPNTRVLWSPRVGFNWNVDGAFKTQVRGGAGLITGRTSLVWLSNQYNNTGVTYATAILQRADLNAIFGPLIEARDTVGRSAIVGNPFYSPDVSPQGEINLTNPDFRLPQVLRATLAVDRKLPWGLVGSATLLYTKTLNNIYVRDINIGRPTNIIPFEDRPQWGEVPGTAGRVDPENFDGVYVLENTNLGYQYSATFELSKRAKNVFARAAYTLSKATDFSSSNSPTAGTNWARQRISNDVNFPGLGTSRYDSRHRVLANASYTFKYSKKASTRISLFYNGEVGTRFSFRADGDVNHDGQFGNDLFYIPNNNEEILFEGFGFDPIDAPDLVQYDLDGDNQLSSSEQWTALDNLIESVPSLRNNRGSYSEKFSDFGRWTHNVDVRIAQFFTYSAPNGKKHRFEVNFSVLNIGNLINPNWGTRYLRPNGEIVNYTARVDPESGRPLYRFTGERFDLDRFSTGTRSRWRAQIGIRYAFNPKRRSF
ncbi:MAG: TonB-dependent receptor [Bacteroidota bacterium]